MNKSDYEFHKAMREGRIVVEHLDSFAGWHDFKIIAGMPELEAFIKENYLLYKRWMVSGYYEDTYIENEPSVSYCITIDHKHDILTLWDDDFKDSPYFREVLLTFRKEKCIRE